MEKLKTHDGVLDMSNQHIWQCSSGKVVGSVHFVVDHSRFDHGYVEDLLFRVNRVFKKNGISESTVQIRPDTWCQGIGDDME